MGKKNEKNKAFLMRDEYEDMYKLLPPKEAKDMILKMFAYFKRDESPKDLSVGQEMFWSLVKQHIDEDMQKYDNKVETNRANAQKRYATASDGMRPHATAANKRKEKEIKENEIYSNNSSQNYSNIKENKKAADRSSAERPKDYPPATVLGDIRDDPAVRRHLAELEKAKKLEAEAWERMKAEDPAELPF